MAKNKNAVPTLPEQTSTPGAPAAVAPAAPVKVTKMARKQAEGLVAAGIITAEQFAEMDKKQLITSGDGGGEDIFEQITKAGVPKADIDALKSALEKVNSALWKDAKTFKGTPVPHKFSFTGEDKKSYTYEAPAEIETALWVKHFDPNQKANREAAIKKG